MGQNVYIKGEGKGVEPLRSLIINSLDRPYPEIILLGIALISEFLGFGVKDTSASVDGYFSTLADLILKSN